MMSLGTNGVSSAARLDDHNSVDLEVRLTLLDAGRSRTTALDGAWWPRSRSLTDELPSLITELHRCGLRIARVTYNPVLWDSAPHRLWADGRIVRLGWFHSMDRHLLSMTGNYGDDRVELLVVPPDAAPETATTAMTRAASHENRFTPTAVLSAAGGDSDDVTDMAPRVSRPRPPDPVVTDLAAATVWESEGGHLHR